MSIFNIIFHHDRDINPFPVSDTVRFRNLDKSLTLTVKTSASTIVIGIRRAQDAMKDINDDSPENAQCDAAVQFAGAIFGRDQAEKLLEFYDRDAMAVISACGMYFSQRLGKLITKAQKNRK